MNTPPKIRACTKSDIGVRDVLRRLSHYRYSSNRMELESDVWRAVARRCGRRFANRLLKDKRGFDRRARPYDVRDRDTSPRGMPTTRRWK